MFTGLILGTGTVRALDWEGDLCTLRVEASVASEATIGDSVAVNGCCLTVVKKEENGLAFNLLRETLDRTAFRAATVDRGNAEADMRRDRAAVSRG